MIDGDRCSNRDHQNHVRRNQDHKNRDLASTQPPITISGAADWNQQSGSQFWRSWLRWSSVLMVPLWQPRFWQGIRITNYSAFIQVTYRWEWVKIPYQLTTWILFAYLLPKRVYYYKSRSHTTSTCSKIKYIYETDEQYTPPASSSFIICFFSSLLVLFSFLQQE